MKNNSSDRERKHPSDAAPLGFPGRVCPHVCRKLSSPPLLLSSFLLSALILLGGGGGGLGDVSPRMDQIGDQIGLNLALRQSGEPAIFSPVYGGALPELNHRLEAREGQGNAV